MKKCVTKKEGRRIELKITKEASHKFQIEYSQYNFYQNRGTNRIEILHD